MAYTTVTSNCTRNSFKVDELQEGCLYYFRVLAVNEHGVGLAAETKDPVKIAEVPMPPSLHWVRVNKECVCDLTFQTTKLHKGCQYEFRVYAENAAGLSLPSDPSPLTNAEDPQCVPSPPSKPKVIDSTKNSITIIWNKPLMDGGSPVTGYNVEYKKTEEEDWIVAAENTKNTEYTVAGLTSGAEYVFVVKSVNKIGVSDPSAHSVPQVAKERVEEPTFQVDKEMHRTLVVKHNTSFTLKVQFKGKPVPSVMWQKEDVNLKDSATIYTNDNSTSITVEKATRNDSGKYTVTLDNSIGTAALTLDVKVLDSPGPPSKLSIKEVTKDSLILTWDAPDNDGGDPVKNYHVEKHEASKKAWVSVTNNCHHLTYEENAEYFFRVRAENYAGLSEPKDINNLFMVLFLVFIESPEFDLKNFPHNTVYVRAGSNLTFEIPLTGKPLPKLTISKDNFKTITADKITFTWDPPVDEGGAKVTHYVVEKRETSRVAWSVISEELEECYISVEKLIRSNEYIFRVRGVNKYGIGDPLESEPVVAKDAFGK
uniref:Titin n=1 Tax=Paramormyrops kingsleyae TaxID=1676925 RepID=A0A3B3Q955_9TELE